MSWSFWKRRRGLLACLAILACVQAAAAQGLRQVGNDAFGMTIEEVHPGASGIRIKVLIENLTASPEVFLHHEANQLDAQDFFFLPAARKNRQRSRDTFVLPVAPAGTASADLFFPIEPGNNPGLLILGNNKPPFEQVAVALGPILKGISADDLAEAPAGLLQPVTPTPAPRSRPEPAVARPPVHESAPKPAPPAPQTPEPAEIIMTPPPVEIVMTPPPEPVEIVMTPAPVATAAAKSAVKPAAKAAAKPVARPAVKAAPKPQADQFYTPPGAPPQTRWIPVDESTEPAPTPRYTTPGAPPQTGGIPVDDAPQAPTAGDVPVSEPVAPPPPPPPRPQSRPKPDSQPKQQPTPLPRPAVRAPAPPAPQAARPKIVFLPNTPGDRVLQVYNTPHASLGDRLVLRAGRKGHSGYGWARIRDEHPDVNAPDLAMAATYPHQVWSDGRTYLYLRWSEDQNGAVVLQVAGDLIVNAQWATYDELLYWLGPGRIYPRLMYQGAR